MSKKYSNGIVSLIVICLLIVVLAITGMNAYGPGRLLQQNLIRLRQGGLMIKIEIPIKSPVTAKQSLAVHNFVYNRKEECLNRQAVN